MHAEGVENDRGLVAGGGDQAEHQHAVTGGDGQGPGWRQDDLLADATGSTRS